MSDNREQQSLHHLLRRQLQQFELPVAQQPVELRRLLYAIDQTYKQFDAEIPDSTVQLKLEIEERQRVEESLRQSELRLRGIFNALDEAVLVFDQDEILVNMNQVAERLFGWKLDEVRGLTAEFLYPTPDQDGTSRQEARQNLVNRIPSAGWTELKRSDGRVFPAEHAISRLSDPQGAVLGMVHVVRDMSGRDRLERIRTVVSNISDASLELDSAEELCGLIHRQIGTLLDARNFFVALYHRDRSTYTLPYIVDQYDKDAFSNIGELRMENSMTDYVRRTGQPLFVDEQKFEELKQRGEIRLIGTPCHQWMGVPLRTREGVSGVVVVQTYDPSCCYTEDHFDLMIRVSEQIGYAVERKRAEQSLRASEERNRALLNAIPDLMFVLDHEGRYLDYNASGLERLYVPPEQFLGRLVTEVLEPELAAETLRHLNSALSTGKVQVFEYRLEIGNEGESWFEARMAVAARNEVLCIIRDITAQKRAENERTGLERQMQHAQKLESLGVLAGGIAHDFNNLLVGIMGNANLALARMNGTTSERNLVENIHTAAMRAADLTRQMLAYSGKGSFVIEPLDLGQAIEELSHLLKVSISKHCRLVYDFGKDIPPVNGDATQIRQVVMNLITNASDAIGENSGTITVRIGTTELTRETARGVYLDSDLEEGLYSYLEITDTGSGMSKETVDKMFDPFFTTKFTGRGLGLAAVLGIVRSHKGAIKVYSEPGKGTTIRVLLPSSESKVMKKKPSVEAPARDDGSHTLLVVDDDETVRQVARMMLEGNGSCVITAGDGLEALEIYRTQGDQISLVLLDMTMPQMDGEETFSELQKLNPDVRVILSSGYNRQDALSHFKGDKLAGFIQKPYQMNELLTEVQRGLRQETVGAAG